MALNPVGVFAPGDRIPEIWLTEDGLHDFTWNLFLTQFPAWCNTDVRGRFQVFMAERQRQTGRGV